MSTELGPGVVVADRYRLDRHLGKGGMGQVWAATHLVTGRTVALKLLNATFPPRDAKRRFLREAKLASLVSHQNVVNVHDFFELADGRPVMVMDVLEGETLREKLAREETLSLDVAASVLLPVVSAVGTAHACGVVHRDLKPENVFLSRAIGGRLDVRVLDFGIAKLMGRAGASAEEGFATTTTGGVLATVWYMSPEQGCGEEVDHRSDIWSLGVLMYEVLSGSRPVEGANYGQVLKRLLNESITPLDVLVPELPKELLALVGCMLQRRAEARPQDLREVAEVLGRFTSVEVPPFGAPQPEPVLPPDSSPSSVAHTVVGSATRSDPYAATDMVGSDDAATSPDPEPMAAPPRNRRRGPAAFATGLAACVLAAGWSLWSGHRTEAVRPVAATRAPHAPLSLPPAHQPEPATPAVAEASRAEAPSSELGHGVAPPARSNRRASSRVRPPPGPSLRTSAPASEAVTISEPRLRTDPPGPDQWQPDHRMAGAGSQ